MVLCAEEPPLDFRQPQILIFAGPNGAGKSTFAQEFLPAEAQCLRFLNADLIAQGLSPFAPEEVAVQAGKLLLGQLEECIARRESVAFETTLSGKGWTRHIPRWQALGYFVRLYFLRLPDAGFARERVRLRVSEGGHDIPEATVESRFHAGLRHFTEVYQPLVDWWMLFDGSTSTPVLLEEGSR
jgi:predicted ABC-type ATPase